MTEYERLEPAARDAARRPWPRPSPRCEAARLEAQRQQLYLETIAQPNLADYPLYPKRVISFLMVFATCFLVYGLAWLLVANVREHSAA